MFPLLRHQADLAEVILAAEAGSLKSCELRGYLVRMEKNMETTIVFRGLGLGFGAQSLGFRAWCLGFTALGFEFAAFIA